MNQIHDIWKEKIDALWNESKAFVVGVFNLQGELLFSNEGFQNLFEMVKSPKDIFINPKLDSLLNKSTNGEEIFRGMLTLGDGGRNNFSIEAKAYKNHNEVLVVGDYDVGHLIGTNLKMVELNQEINNLQRELIKEKKILQVTLDKLKETQDMLIHSEKMNALGQLVAGIAHEINNPIAFVSSNLHFLKDAFEDVQKAYTSMEKLIQNSNDLPLYEESQKIRKQYDISYLFEDFKDLEKGSFDGLMRVKKIVENLKVFSRLDESAFQDSELVENIKATLVVAEPEFKKRHIKVELNVEHSIFLECYPSELNQVFLNLIINANQAMEEEGILKIDIEDRGASAVVRFSDNGCGIPDEVIKKIFNPLKIERIRTI